MAKESDSVWCLLMFDLPTLSRQQRRDASKFRNALLDQGFCMIQLSVYARHARYATEYGGIVRYVKRNLPEGGEVRLALLSDIQWAKMFRFVSARRESVEKIPEQLAIF